MLAGQVVADLVDLTGTSGFGRVSSSSVDVIRTPLVTQECTPRNKRIDL